MGEKARDAAWRILQGAKEIGTVAQAAGQDMLAFLIEHVIHEANTIVEQNGGPAPPTNNVMPFRPKSK